MHKVTIPMTVTITYNGSETAFISNADYLSRSWFNEGLDSLDAGDATGVFLRMLESGHDEDDSLNFDDGTTVRFTREYDLFQHEGDW